MEIQDDRTLGLREDIRTLLDDLELESIRVLKEVCIGCPPESEIAGKVYAVIEAGSMIESIVDRYGSDEDRRSVVSVLNSMRDVGRSIGSPVSNSVSKEFVELVNRAEGIVRRISSIEGAAIAPIGKWIRN